MLILAVDSTAAVATATIADARAKDDVRLLGLTTISGAKTHSEILLPMIDAELKNLRLTLGDIELLACSVGPGSFTGVRIGAAMIKGLALPQNKPCVGVSTLEALAYNLEGFDGIVCPVMDARRSQLYTAAFRGGKRLTADDLISAEALGELLVTLLESENEKIYFTGDGYRLARRLIELPQIADTPELLRWQNAFSVARAAYAKFLAEGAVEGSKLSPVYLRASQAERERLQKIENDNGD